MSDEVTLNFISSEEAWNRFDLAARELLELSGEEFARRLDVGDISELPQSPAMRVAMLRPQTA